MSIGITESKLKKFNYLMEFSGQSVMLAEEIENIACCLIRANIVNHYPDGLTAVYMAGVESGKKRSEAEIKRLQQENQSLKNVVKELIGNTLKRDDEGDS